MNERSVNRRLLLCGLVLLVGVVLLYPPGQKLRAGLDIAGGTSLIFEIDTTDAGSDPTLAERVKTLLQRRVDPKGVYALVWRVQGRNRLEVQMPLPPKDATARREAYATALKDLLDQEIRRGDIMQALDATGEARQAALGRLARGHADEMLGKITGSDEKAASSRAAIEQVVANRQQLLNQAAQAYDAMLAARAAAQRWRSGADEDWPLLRRLGFPDPETDQLNDPFVVRHKNLSKLERRFVEGFGLQWRVTGSAGGT